MHLLVKSHIGLTSESCLVKYIPKGLYILPWYKEHSRLETIHLWIPHTDICPFSQDLGAFHKSLVLSSRTKDHLEICMKATSHRLHVALKLNFPSASPLCISSTVARCKYYENPSTKKDLWSSHWHHVWKPRRNVKLILENRLEKCRAFCWGGRFFSGVSQQRRSRSALGFHLRSPGTGDRLILSCHCGRGSVMCAFSKRELWQEHRQEVPNGPVGRRMRVINQRYTQPKQFNENHTHTCRDETVYITVCMWLLLHTFGKGY